MGKVKVIFFTCFMLFLKILHAQQNLVPNPSFELNSSCPDNLSGAGDDQVTKATGWSTYGQTPDYFNICSSVWNASVPNNQPGFQFAHTGNAYCGLITYQTSSFYREIIGSQLVTPLAIGQKYFISFFTSLAGKPGCSMATNRIGMKFSNTSYNFSSPVSTNNIAHLYSSNIITDTVNWIKISGSFIADSSYQYVMVGNFFDDMQTDTISINNSPFTGYYFIDDVCVSTDSVYAADWTGLLNSDREGPFKIHPRPFEERLIIHAGGIPLGETIYLEVFSLTGNLVFKNSFRNEIQNNIHLNILKGVYILHLSTSSISCPQIIIKK